MASRGGRSGGRANPNAAQVGYGGVGGGGEYYGGRGGGNADGGAGRGRGYNQGGGDGGGHGRGYYQGDGGGGGRGRGYQGYQSGGDGGGRGRGRGYQGGGDGGGRGRGYQGDSDGGRGGRGRGGYQQGGNDYGRGRGGGYQVGNDYGGGRGGGGDGGRGRGRGGYQQGGNDYGGGRGGYQGGNNYGGGRGGGQNQPVPNLHQATGPPLSDRYAAEAAQLREQFKGLDINRAEPTFPARPGFGTAGRSCVLRANHFFVGLVDKGLHQYDVAISPEPTLPSVYRVVMSSLVSEHQHTSLGGRLPAYDGRKILYTAGELPFNSKEFEVTLSDKIGSSGPRREKKYNVTIKHTNLVSLQQLQMLMAGFSTDIPAQALTVLDIVLRDIVLNERNDMEYVKVGRSFFSWKIERPTNLGLGIQGWAGFYQSIRPTQSGLSLNIDVSSTAFVQAMPLIDFVGEILKRNGVINSITDYDYVKIKKALRGLRIEVTHRGEMRRKYRISGLTKQSTRDLRFESSTGVSKTVKEYFRETYNLQLRYDFLPCLQVGTEQKPNYLPMEVCNIVLGQRYQKKLDETQVTNMMAITCKRPSARETSIHKIVQKNNYNSTKRANEFGIEVDYNPTSVQARILTAPVLKYYGSGSNKCVPNNGKWNMVGKKVVNGAKVVNWLCVNFCHNLSLDDAGQFCFNLSAMCRTTGLSFQDGNPKISYVRPEQVEAALKEICLQARAVQKIDLLVALLPDKNGSLYGDIKRICETDIGVMSQCCLRKNVLNSSPQCLANVALKINAKCGGRNSVFADIPASLPVVSNKPTIIFGADVTHPNALDDSAPSIAAVVASQDWPEVTKYHGDVHAQGHREELIQGLEDIVKKLLLSFQRESKQRPQQLIFYRDGVSEGQFRQVLEKEIPEIEKAWKSLYNEKAPITFIVVQKRHHTRLFPSDSNQDTAGNVLPGTVVDTKICHPTEFDFFLCSHAGIKGTSRPTHYHILRDDNNFTADALQSLTNNLCYTYASCTRSVSTAPPAYYAHKLAFRARFYQTLGSDVASEVSSSSAAPPGVMKPLPEIKDELKRLMFYC
ncbi:protein argonaute PNH1 [Lolium perenne]|uniref:protein argonaute PNH1 n=1 Tax=Lolium perenne TaxID=4522 RepID=UPI0021F52741|nr:protein argonaute 18-like [Lolium perenne]